MKMIALFSGGLDSAVMLYQARKEGHDVRAFSVDYGQRHSWNELACARSIASGLDIPHDISYLGSAACIFTANDNAVSGCGKLPVGVAPDDPSQSITVVPGRNLALLSLAVARAASMGYSSVGIVATKSDAEVYSDCRPAFLEAFRHTIDDAYGIGLYSPFTGLVKGDVVARGVSLGVPLQKTWSCYTGNPKHCGQCGACISRKQAFDYAGTPDPTEYHS